MARLRRGGQLTLRSVVGLKQAIVLLWEVSPNHCDGSELLELSPDEAGDEEVAVRLLRGRCVARESERDSTPGAGAEVAIEETAAR